MPPNALTSYPSTFIGTSPVKVNKSYFFWKKKSSQRKRNITQGKEEGDLTSAKKCNVLFEWPLIKTNDNLIYTFHVDVEWRIGSTHDFGARGPGFDSHPDLPSPFFQTTDLKTISLICNIVMSS